MSKKTSINILIKYAKNRGGELLSKEYINANTPVEWKCSEGHIWKARWHDISRNHWCKICAYKVLQNPRKKYTNKALEKLIKKYNGKFLDNYTTYRKIYGFQCKEGHIFKLSLKALEKGSWCKQCKQNNYLENYSAVDLISLDKEYKGLFYKYNWLCKKGHKQKRTLQSLKYKNFCLRCNKEEINKEKIKELKEIAQTKGGDCLADTYPGPYKKMTFICSKGHKWKATKHLIKGDQTWCPKCKSFVSESEKDLLNFVKLYKNCHKIKLNKLAINSKKELDVYVPELSLGLEYCGVYWHSSKFKPKNYHYNKYKLCKDNNIRLLTIFEDEWLNRNSQVKNFIRNILKVNSIRLNGRDCEVKVLGTKEAINFINDYHIQPIKNSSNIKLAFGIYYINELQGVLTASKHHRSNDQDIIVLSRMVFKENTNIIGGASKLFKYFKNWSIKNNYKKIVSWSDNRYSEGSIYETLGFIKELDIRPDYSYIAPNKVVRYSKQSNKKTDLLKKGATGNTEEEMALSLNLYRIYDCGKKRFVYNLR